MCTLDRSKHYDSLLKWTNLLDYVSVAGFLFFGAKFDPRKELHHWTCNEQSLTSS